MDIAILIREKGKFDFEILLEIINIVDVVLRADAYYFDFSL